MSFTTHVWCYVSIRYTQLRVYLRIGQQNETLGKLSTVSHSSTIDNVCLLSVYRNDRTEQHW